MNATSSAQQSPVTALVATQGIDLEANTVTLPLRQGSVPGGETVWYVLLDTDDEETAKRLGINWSAKLGNADVVRTGATGSDGAVQFTAGGVDFAPERQVVPGAFVPFPPQKAEPGSVADEDYTPLYRDRASGHVFNAPVIAQGVSAAELNRFCAGDPDYAQVHDKVVRICPREGTVTLALTEGFSHGERIVYISTEASDAGVAALEGATFAPALKDIETGLYDRSDSAVEPIFVVVNGATGADDPNRQGLYSALSDGLGPLNIVDDIPGFGNTYSPLWDAHPIVWAGEIADRGEQTLLTHGEIVRQLAVQGLLTNLRGDVVSPEGVIVNCPVIGHLP